MQSITGSSFAIKEMIKLGWPILSVLLGFSIVSIAVMWDRWKTFAKARRGIPQTMSHISSRLSHVSGMDERERIVSNEITRWAAPLEQRLAILGSIAAASPFVGLLGTVIGIIRAFRAVSISMGGGHAVVANGIAEALIATAIGLFVAIPALLAYNFFNSKLHNMETQLQIAANDLITKK